MTALPPITTDYFQILVTRELRKVGLEVGEIRIQRRSELPEPERGFVLELLVPLSRPGTAWNRRALVVCRRQEGVIEREVIESARTRMPAAKADAVIVFATADFQADALAAAEGAGVVLLRVVDGRTAFDMSGWSTPDHYPAWLPAYLTQLLDRDAAGLPRRRLLEADRPEMILDGLGVESHT